MEELRCKNCNGNDFELIDGLYVCQNCGSKFIVPEAFSVHDEEPEEAVEPVYMDIPLLCLEEAEELRQQKEAAKASLPDHVKSIYDIPVTTAKWEPVSMEAYRGKVLLITNSARRWSSANTEAYDCLRILHKRYHDRGLEILDFPCPATDGQFPNPFFTLGKNIIYRLDIIFFNKFTRFVDIQTTGEKKSVLFTWLISEAGGDMEEPFTGYLVDRNGTVQKRFKKLDKYDIEYELKPLLDEEPSA